MLLGERKTSPIISLDLATQIQEALLTISPLVQRIFEIRETRGG
jgi:hypothetical protein